ncbi:MAG: 4'-phosphopantetheinyl transferase superfamily protein [Lachnospiraceae bacterium]|nr:4'-phosphopantetheinyl transferase superfamily protein [Lachnospiraceae bacterium]
MRITEKETGISGHIIRLYWLNTEDFTDEMFWDYYKKLSSARRQKTDKYRFANDRQLSVGAGILLDKGLSYYGLEEAGVQLSYNENGKPFLPDFPEIHFNLSHSEKMVFAIFTDTEAGCDIEKIKPANLGVARRFFCASEYGYIAGQKNKTEKQEAFYRLWTLKESFVKSTGTGLLIPLNSFEIKFGPDICMDYIMEDNFANNNLDIKIFQNIDNAKYYFQSYIDNGYCASVCLRVRDTALMKL